MPAHWASSPLHRFVVGVGEGFRTGSRQAWLLQHLLCPLDENRVVHHCPPTLLCQIVPWAVARTRRFCYSHGVAREGTVRSSRLPPSGRHGNLPCKVLQQSIVGVLERRCGQTSETGSNKRRHHLNECVMVVRRGDGDGGNVDVWVSMGKNADFMERSAILVCGIVLGYLSKPRTSTAS